MPSPKNTKTRSSVVGKFTSLFFGSAKPKDVKPSQLPALPDEPAAEDAGAAADAYSAFMPMQLSKHVVGEHFKGAGLARTLQPGEVLIAKGEPSDSLFFVISGTLNVMAGGGDEEKEAELAMGEIIGYSSFLLGMLPTRSVLAADGAPTCVLELTFDTAIKLIRTDSQVATDVFRELAVAVTERIEKRSSVLRSSVLQLATATDHGQEDVTVQKAPKGARAAARLAERFFDYGVDVDEVLLLTCPCALLSVEANSKERATRQKAKGGAEDEADDDGELFLFEEHLCVELELFNMTLVTCVELESILSLIKLGGGVVEVECSDRSFTLALDPSRFDEVTTKIEACRIACIPLNQPLGDGDRSSYINNVSGALDGDRGGERVSLDDLAEMSSIVVDMPAEMDLTEPSTMSKKVRNISVDLRSSMKERSKAHGLSMYDAGSQQAVDLPAELQAEFQTEEAYPVGGGGRASSAASAAATQAKKLKQLGQSLTMAEWQQFVGGVERRTLKQGEPIIEEGDSPRALYYILRGTIRLEMTIHETTGTDEAQGQRANKRSSKAVRSSRAGRRSHDEMGKKRAVVGRFHAGDMFGFKTLLLGLPSQTRHVCSSHNARILVLREATLNTFAHLHPQLVPKLFCYVAAVQMKSIALLDEEHLDEALVLDAESKAPTDMQTIVTNPAYASILHRFVATMTPEQKTHVEVPLNCLTHLQEFARSTQASGQLLVRATELFELYFDEKGSKAVTFVSEAMRKRLKHELAKGLELTPAQMRHLFDVSRQMCTSEVETHCLAPFLRSLSYKYLQLLKDKEERVLSMRDFRAERLLGKGGYGKVIEVIKRDCGKRYAMKVMHRPDPRNGKEKARRWTSNVLTERKLLGSLHHPLLVNMAYAFQTDALVALVMDICPGNDLSRFIGLWKEGGATLSAEQIHFVGLEVVCILKYLHSKHVLYRDLKPENLLLDGTGHVRLIDFGLSIAASDGVPLYAYNIAGTPPYMAPEVLALRDEPGRYTLPADWYTLGVLLYELAEQELPFGGGAPKFINFDMELRPMQLATRPLQSLIRALICWDQTARLGFNGAEEVMAHPYWHDVERVGESNNSRASVGDRPPDWELADQKRLMSPLLEFVTSVEQAGQSKGQTQDNDRKSVVPSEQEAHAVQLSDEQEAESHDAALAVAKQISADSDQQNHMHGWDFVSPQAIAQEYVEQMSSCVTAT